MSEVYDLDSLVAGLQNKTLTFSADKPVHACFSSNMSLLSEPIPNPSQEGMVGIQAKAYHDGCNLNGSKIEFDTFMAKTNTMAMRPILANVIKKDDGSMDFGSHDRAYYFDEEGNLIEEVIEKPIGCISSFSFERDTSQGVTRAIANGYLWQDYASDAIDILNERGEVDCSVELSIKAIRFEEETLVLDDYFVMGLTLLGKDFEPGMAGSKASMKQFVTEPQKKDEDDQELLKTIEEEEAEALKKQQEEEERQRQEEEEHRQAGDAASRQDSPSMVSSEPEKSAAKAKSGANSEKESEPKNEVKQEPVKDAKPGKETEASTLKADSDAEKAPQDEAIGTHALILESLGKVITTDEKGETLYLFDYSGSPANPLEGEGRQVAAIDLETMGRYAQEGKELLAFRKERARAEKEEIINDDLYKPYLNSAEFREIAENIDIYSLDEVNHKCLAAFAKNKKEESVQSPFQLKQFAAQKISSVKSTYREERYGSIFARKEKK